MGWGEAFRLTQVLIADTSSQVGAAVRGWQYPMERSDVVLRDLFDKYTQSHFKRPPAYPRPWDPQPKKMGDARLTPGQFRAIRDSVAARN